MRDVYVVIAKRTAVAKAKRGALAQTRPDELLADLMRLTAIEANINPEDIEDVIIGCAFPEAEQGVNIARVSALMAGFPNNVPGFTINRYCSSGLQSIAIGADRIATGFADLIVAGGIESMSLIPMGGHNLSLSPRIFEKDNDLALAYGMGLTAECVAKDYNISREDQDKFAYNSHMRAINAINSGFFDDQICSMQIIKKKPNYADYSIQHEVYDFKTDEGARSDTSIDVLAKLKPVFAKDGSVTAGNSSQMSDGAGCVILASEDYVKKHNLNPIGKFLGFSVAGVPPRVMGIGPIKAIPQLLNKLQLQLNQIDWIELNEAFAAQSLAVIRTLGLDKEEGLAKINPDGGAIALGHPLGATGAILTSKMFSGLRRNKRKYGMVTMCIGAGMGAAGIFEAFFS